MATSPLAASHRGPKFSVTVRLGEIGLVVPCSHTTDKVARLCRDIANRFEAHGIKPGELGIAELSTADGFPTNTNDISREVISDGEHLIALDYDDWVVKQTAFCKTEWMRVINDDYVDGAYKWVIVGLF